jgi:hypothetical protein
VKPRRRSPGAARRWWRRGATTSRPWRSEASACAAPTGAVLPSTFARPGSGRSLPAPTPWREPGPRRGVLRSSATFRLVSSARVRAGRADAGETLFSIYRARRSMNA